MSDRVDQLLQEHLDSAPKEVREAILDFDLGRTVDEIARAHSLSERQAEIYDAEVVFAVVGARHPNNMQQNLTEPDGGETFSPRKAKELHAAFYTQVLEPIMQDAERRGYSFSDEDSKRRSRPKQSNGTLFQKKNIRVTYKTFEQGAHSYPVRNISKVVDYDIWNLDFGGVIANGGISLLGLFGLFIDFVLCKIVGVIGLLIGGFNLYNMFSTPKHYIVSIEFISGEDVDVKYESEEPAKKLRRALDEAMAGY